MMDMHSVCERRSFTPEELGGFVAGLRQANGWTQETLAEIAGLTARTVQRVETGEPTSLDTRRSLARAFGYGDLDTFSKPWPLPNFERLSAELERLDRDTVVIPIETVRSGRHLRELAELANGWQHNLLGELTPAAEEAFAALQELFQDYADCSELYSPSQKLGVNATLQAVLEALARESISVSAGTRRVRLTWELKSEDLPATVVYILAASASAPPATIRVPRRAQMGW